MAPKTTNQPKVESEASAAAANWNFLFKWLFILGGLTAGVLNALIVNEVITVDDQYSYIVSALMVVGILVGIFYFDSDDLINIGLRFMIFGAAANSINGLYKIGVYLAPFFMGFAYYLGPIVLTLVVVYFVKKYILNK
ncbi:MAG: hypothetical protein HY864_11020 [Chloroflexi bacterium]|nr:hypothetical protein [Chloroflexota bacterium]